MPRCRGADMLESQHAAVPHVALPGCPARQKSTLYGPDKQTRTATGGEDELAGGTVTNSVRPAGRQGRWRARNSVMPCVLVGFPWGKLRHIATRIGDSARRRCHINIHIEPTLRPTVRQRRPRPSAKLAVHPIDESVLGPRILDPLAEYRVCRGQVPRHNAGTSTSRDSVAPSSPAQIHDIRITAVAFQSASTTITGCRGTSIPAKLEGTTYPLHGIFRCAGTPGSA